MKAKRKSTSGTINENNAKTGAVGKSYVKAVKEHTASVPEPGRPCSQRRFLEEFTKRINSQNTHVEENMLHEFKVYLDVKKKYLVLMQEAQRREINQTKWTQKITSESVDSLILGAVNGAEYATQNPPKRTLADEEPENKDLEEVKKCMREMNLILAFKLHCHEALNILTDRVRIPHLFVPEGQRFSSRRKLIVCTAIIVPYLRTRYNVTDNPTVENVLAA
ncbi:unnamed protein product [Thelazia callipaeda]|uniref:Caprin-1_dimer domain-containing protein n=1 Tax=Thelazia callipaeda TaxID=103827 RepID=A0A0N5DCB8_THECL|nr:unnamed protein product [Thelazia callipaeda]